MKFLGIKIQKMMFHCLDHGYISYRDQNIYKNRIIFNKLMDNLIDLRWITVNLRNISHYQLTFYGEIIAKSIRNYSKQKN